jgi:hypothetical protein
MGDNVTLHLVCMGAVSLSHDIPPDTPHAARMTPDEKRSAFSLASIYALRMLGLFMVLPVFMIEARHGYLWLGASDAANSFRLGR